MSKSSLPLYFLLANMHFNPLFFGTFIVQMKGSAPKLWRESMQWLNISNSFSTKIFSQTELLNKLKWEAKDDLYYSVKRIFSSCCPYYQGDDRDQPFRNVDKILPHYELQQLRRETSSCLPLLETQMSLPLPCFVWLSRSAIIYLYIFVAYAW